MKMHNTSAEHLSQRVFLILTCLEDGPLHIVALKNSIEQHNNNDLEPGTLYRELAHLEQSGWIMALHDRDSLYQLTESGKVALKDHRSAIHERRERIGVLPRNTFFKAKTTKERTMKLLTWIIKLYPKAWRTRYETEMLAVLEAHTVTLWTLFDLLFGAVDARLDPHYRSEKALFSFKNVQMATFAFIVALAIAIVCMFIWSIEATPLQNGGEVEGNAFTIATISHMQFLEMMLFISNMLIAIIAAKRAITAKRIHIGAALLAVICFVVAPFIILSPYAPFLISEMGISLNSGIANLIAPLWFSFAVFAGLELLMGCLFLIIINGRTAITTHKKRPLLLIALVTLILALIGYWFNTSPFIFPGGFMNSMWGLLPFAGIGALLLALTNIKMSRRNLHIALIPAIVLTGIMIVSLLGAITWEIISWKRMVQVMGPRFFFDGRYPLIATIVLVVATICALAALKYCFSALKASRLNTHVENVYAEDATQMLPPQVQ